MRKAKVLSIDPGKTGAMTLLCDGKLLATHQFNVMKGQRFFGFEEELSIHNFVNEHEPDHIVIEGLLDQRMASQSPVHTNTTAVNWGFLLGCLFSSGFQDVQIVRPSEWKMRMRLPGGKENKFKSLDMARELFPETADTCLKLKKNIDVAEAILIGVDYGRENLGWK